MAELEILNAKLNERLAHLIQKSYLAYGQMTLEIASENLKELCLTLRDDPEFDFKMLLDICGVDYLHYGLSEWETESTTNTGFSRGVTKEELITPLEPNKMKPPSRFATVYQLLSINQNHRVRLRVFLDAHFPKVSSVIDIWPSANWFEREAFDLFGIEFEGHPDLRRLLTDYGFIGHPFRKDFPLIGKMEVRYDAKEARVIYEPVSIKPRILEPKVIRHDNRYQVRE